MDQIKLYDRTGAYSGKFIYKEKAINELKEKLLKSHKHTRESIWNILVSEANRNGLYLKDQLKNMRKGQVIVS